MTEPKNPDRHRLPGVLVRVDAAERIAARAAIKDRGWTMNDFMAACIRLVAANPDAMLRSLARFRQPTRRGRPPASG